MTDKAVVQISYDPTVDSSCSGELFEIPKTQVVGGDVVQMLIWGMNFDNLAPYNLFKGTESMGYGVNVTTSSDEITAIVDFAETFNYQAEYPIFEINRIEAVTEILYEDFNGDIVTWATKGQNVTSLFRRKGYSCIEMIDQIEIYGSVKFKYQRPPYHKLWEWTVPTNSEGLHWFFIYKINVLKNKFSIELPDLTSGPADYRNIMIYVTSRAGDEPVEFAEVYIDGYFVGVTEETTGAITIDNIQVGSHSIQVVAAGYQDTDLDNLSNDIITVY